MEAISQKPPKGRTIDSLAPPPEFGLTATGAQRVFAVRSPRRRVLLTRERKSHRRAATVSGHFAHNKPNYRQERKCPINTILIP